MHAASVAWIEPPCLYPPLFAFLLESVVRLCAFRNVRNRIQISNATSTCTATPTVTATCKWILPSHGHSHTQVYTSPYDINTRLTTLGRRRRIRGRRSEFVSHVALRHGRLWQWLQNRQSALRCGHSHRSQRPLRFRCSQHPLCDLRPLLFLPQALQACPRMLEWGLCALGTIHGLCCNPFLN